MKKYSHKISKSKSVANLLMIQLKSNSISLHVIMSVGRCECVGRGVGERQLWRLCLEALVLDQLLDWWTLITLDLEAAQRKVPSVF